MNDVDFLPPYRFSELEPRFFGPEGSGAIFTQGSGQPYDLITDLPVSAGRTTTSARGGAVHFSNPPQTNTGSRSYPDIDRGFYYRVDDAEVLTQSFWGVNSDYYFQTIVKQNEASIWGYANQGAYNFKQKVDSSEVKYELWNSGGDYYNILVKSNESSFWGASASGFNYKTIADSSKASIEAWGQGKFIIIATDDFTEGATTVKLRELDLCDGKKALFLCSEPYDAN